MASFTCHVVCVTKRLRLERLVRPPHAELAPDLATAQPLSRTVQQVWPASPGLEPDRPKRRCCNSRGLELSPHSGRSRLGQLNLAESRTCPKSRVIQAWLPMPSPRVRDANAADERDA